MYLQNARPLYLPCDNNEPQYLVVMATSDNVGMLIFIYGALNTIIILLCYSCLLTADCSLCVCVCVHACVCRSSTCVCSFVYSKSVSIQVVLCMYHCEGFSTEVYVLKDIESVSENSAVN